LPWLPGDDGGADGTSTEQPVVTDGAGGKTSGLERADEATDSNSSSEDRDAPSSPGGRDGVSPGDDTLGGRDSTDEEIDISAVALLDTLPRPGFIVDTSHCIVGWNEELEELTGVDRESVLGQSAAERLYRDGGRTETLADTVVDNPDTAHEVSDAERSGRDQRAYERDETLQNAAGDRVELQSVATPIYQSGDLVGVLQLHNDITEKIQRREAMQELVRQSAETGDRIADGQLDARVSFDGDEELLDPTVVELTDVIDDIAASTQELIREFAAEVSELSESATEIADTAVEIDDRVDSQTDSLDAIVREMEDLSATMEEVASSSNQVATAASQAREAAENGMEANQSARETVDEVSDVTAELVETVDELDERMAEIDEVVDVIGEIAEQTDILALNASIEAARAGEEGDGFAVVAEEVKSLAAETKQHTDEISDRIETLQRQTAETVETTETTDEHVREADAEIERALAALGEIADAVEEVSEGVDEVARANEDQAVSVEESTTTATEVQSNAHEIAERVGEITEETAEQRDSVDDIADSLAELGGTEETVVGDDGTVTAAAERVDHADTV
jgi:methyl-accepting chemotaxis protein